MFLAENAPASNVPTKNVPTKNIPTTIYSKRKIILGEEVS
jgi:hypothetical protein